MNARLGTVGQPRVLIGFAFEVVSDGSGGYTLEIRRGLAPFSAFMAPSGAIWRETQDFIADVAIPAYTPGPGGIDKPEMIVADLPALDDHLQAPEFKIIPPMEYNGSRHTVLGRLICIDSPPVVVPDVRGFYAFPLRNLGGCEAVIDKTQVSLTPIAFPQSVDTEVHTIIQPPTGATRFITGDGAATNRVSRVKIYMRSSGWSAGLSRVLVSYSFTQHRIAGPPHEAIVGTAVVDLSALVSSTGEEPFLAGTIDINTVFNFLDRNEDWQEGDYIHAVVGRRGQSEFDTCTQPIYPMALVFETGRKRVGYDF